MFGSSLALALAAEAACASAAEEVGASSEFSHLRNLAFFLISREVWSICCGYKTVSHDSQCLKQIHNAGASENDLKDSRCTKHIHKSSFERQFLKTPDV